MPEFLQRLKEKSQEAITKFKSAKNNKPFLTVQQLEEEITREMEGLSIAGKTIWTDGSFDPETGNAAGAAVMLTSDGRYYGYGKRIGIAKHSTEAELVGVLIGSIVAKKFPQIEKI